jgi:multidrug efflux pump subunit AcrA (membrane-fusion protein)
MSRSARATRIAAGVVAVGLVLAGALVWSVVTRKTGSVELPVATARRGEFVVVVRCRGDVKASRAVPIYAPIMPSLSIAWMAPEGEEVKEGSPIIRFDSSSAEQQLVQKQATLKQAQAALEQAQVESRITSAHDRSDVQDATYAVEKARLNTADNEFVGRIQAKEAEIDVSVAEQTLRVQEAKVALNAATARSKIASLTRQLSGAQADVDLTRARIAQMEIRAPLTGFVVFASNYSGGPGSEQPFKVGDNVYSGMNLAEMPDMASLVMDARLEEIDRGRITLGNAVRVRVDALPELAIASTLATISPLTEMGAEWPPVRSFRAYASLTATDRRVRPGMNGTMDIVIKRLPDAVSIPAKAIFTRGGHPIVYLASGGRYMAVDVQILARNPDEVAVSGIDAGAIVTLAEPEKTHAAD